MHLATTPPSAKIHGSRGTAVIFKTVPQLPWITGGGGGAGRAGQIQLRNHIRASQSG